MTGVNTAGVVKVSSDRSSIPELDSTLGGEWFLPLALLLSGIMSHFINAKAAAAKWIVSPRVDALLVCGGLLLFVFVAHVFYAAFSGAYIQASALALMAGTIMFTDTHFGASFLRASGRQSKWKSHYLAPLIGVAVISATLASSMTFVTLALRFYLSIVVYHYAHQTLSLLRKYCERNDYVLPGLQGKLVPLLVYSMVSHAVLVQFSDRSPSFQFLGLTMPQFDMAPDWLTSASYYLIAIVTAAVCFVIAYKGARESKPCPAPILFLLVVTASMFIMSGDLSRVLWLYVPIFLHGAQTVAESIAACRESDGAVSVKKTVSLLVPSMLLGMAAMFGLPFVLIGFGIQPLLAYPAIVVTVSLWHFVCDFAIEFSERHHPGSTAVRMGS